MSLSELAEISAQRAAEELEPEPGKISATGTIGRKLTYVDSTLGTSEYGVFCRVSFMDELGEPGWFFTSSEILVDFFDACKKGDHFPFVGVMRKKKGDYGKMYCEPVE